MKQGRYIILLIAFGSLFLSFNAAAIAQNSPGSGAVENSPVSNPVSLPAIGDFPAPVHDGFLRRKLGLGIRTADKPLDPALTDIAAELMHRRPLMVWRTFAELPLPPVKTFLFLLFADLLICLSFRTRTLVASMHTRSKFWKSLGVGVIVMILGTTCSRLCSETFILRPLASVLLGLLQFFCLAGVAVSSRALGSALLGKFKLLKSDDITERPIRSLVASVLVGTLIISGLAILPGLGSLPRLGARLLMLFCMLGLGAIFSTGFGKKVD